MKPIHRPSSVATTYHSGGTDAVAMAVICAAVLPAMAPGDVAEDQRRRSGRPGSRRRRRRATSSPGAWSAGGPTAYRGRGRRPRAAPRAGAAAWRSVGVVGAGDRRRWRQRRREAACDGGRAGRRRRRLLEPFAGHVPVRDGPGRAGRGARWAGSRPAGLGVGHRQDVTGARTRPPPAGRPLCRSSDGAVTTDQGRRLAWSR